MYQDAQPSLLQRALSWLGERLGDLLPDDLDAGPVVDVVVVVVLAALVLVALRVAGQVVLRRRRAAQAPEVFAAAEGRRTAQEHRRLADQHAAAGDWPAAVAERFRALVRGAEERFLLDERPGRTATEAADELGHVLPGLADGLRAGARTFEDVVYGSAPGDADDDARLRELDGRVRDHRPAREVVTAAPRGGPR